VSPAKSMSVNSGITIKDTLLSGIIKYIF